MCSQLSGYLPSLPLTSGNQGACHRRGNVRVTEMIDDVSV